MTPQPLAIAAAGWYRVICQRGDLMPGELQSLDNIFNSCVFRIPDYQRGYSWGQQQLNDF